LVLGLVEPTTWGTIGCIVCTAGIAVGATNRSSSVER
jgi:hypothetical protein